MDTLDRLWDWNQFFFHFLKLAGSFVLALPIAWERERATRIMGLRTFSLVSVASCGYVLIAATVVGDAADAQARIIQGLMTGIGFIGGGAILKHGANVRGTATAASIWMTGALGAAVGYSQFEIAVLISALNFLTLVFLTPLVKPRGRSADEERPPEDGPDAC